MSDGLCATCETAGCPWRSDLVIACSHYMPKSETNYERLFGTPEQAALTMMRMCDVRRMGCDECPLYRVEIDDCNDYDALLEWLEGNA